MLPLWDSQPSRRVPVVTWLLIAANVGVFAWTLHVQLAGGGEAAAAWVQQHGLVPARLVARWQDEDQWLTLLTHLFLHGGLGHLAGNCWFLWVFGNNVEDHYGSVAFTLFYVTAGLGAAALQMLVEPGAGVPMIGASGAISGVLGAYLVLYPRAWIVALVPWFIPVVPVPAVVFLLGWFALQAMNGFGSLAAGQAALGGVAWWAHAGGFVTGFCLTLWAQAGGRRGGR